MKGKSVCAVLAAILALPACRRAAPESATSVKMPRGDAVWLEDPTAAGEAGLEDVLQRIGAVALFLPAGQIAFETGRWKLEPVQNPPHPLTRVPVALVLEAGPELAGSLLSSEGADEAAVGQAIAATLQPSLAPGGPFGKVSGVLLDFPFAPAGAGHYATLVTALRSALPRGMFVAIALRSVPASEAERKKMDPLLAAADALMAFVFQDGERLDAAAVDALHRPWWAAFGTAGHGTRTAADGSARGTLQEKFLDPLTGNPRIEFQNDLSSNDATLSAFHLTASKAVQIDGLSLEQGERIAFRLPAETEMLFQLGSTLNGKHLALGRVMVFEGAADAERLFPLVAFEDVLLGRTLAPALEVTVHPAGRAVTVEAVNRASHASIVSRSSNWVEVDLAPARPADVQLGGFDRYEVYDSNGAAVTPGRATRVRLFETIVAPREVIAAAHIFVRGSLPKGCCRSRVHVISAAGPEVATDWTEPPAPPPPVANAASKPTKKK